MSTSGQVLKLQLTDDKSLILNSNEFIGEVVEWVVGQDAYDVEITTNSQNLIYNFVITNLNNEPIESILMTAAENNGTTAVYKVRSTIAKFLKSGSKIFIGVTYQIMDKSGKLTNYSSKPLPVILNSSINNYVDPLELKANFSVVADLLTKFNSAKAIEGFEVVENSKDKTYELFVKYVGIEEKQSLKTITPSVEQLGLVIKREGDTGGGGTVGTDAEINYDKTGFAGGYGARTTRGAAVGEKAYSTSGFAGGSNASSKAGGGIAIGANSEVYQKSTSGIAIGTGSTNIDNTASIAIGRYSISNASSYAVVIGSTGFDGTNDDKYITDRIDKDKNSLPPLANQTRATSSPRSVIIGYRAYGVRTEDSVIIGNSASSRSPKNLANRRCVSVGYMSITRNNSCISIGDEAKAGTTYYGLQISGNKSEESKSGGYGNVSAIAIGRCAWARRHSSIALGKHAQAVQHGCLAIGHHSVAGNTNKQYNSKPSSEETDGSRSVAIGWRAVASASGAVQLGTGTNTTKDSLQFKGVTIVKDNVVQVNLSGKGMNGTLPLKKGGTGATSAAGARKNLGIYYGTQAVKDLKISSLSSTGKNITVTFPKDIKFSSPPQVIANLSFGSDDYDPACHHFFIKSISKTGFVLRYNYSGTSGSAKKNFNINYIAIL